jgi:hypothetical protein
MAFYSKNGSIPYHYTDGTDGWTEVPPPPLAPEGKEVIWWYPPGWVIRDPEPAAEEGFAWSWNQSDEQWVKHAVAAPTVTAAPTVAITIATETITLNTASSTITL